MYRRDWLISAYNISGFSVQSCQSLVHGSESEHKGSSDDRSKHMQAINYSTHDIVG